MLTLCTLVYVCLFEGSTPIYVYIYTYTYIYVCMEITMMLCTLLQSTCILHVFHMVDFIHVDVVNICY